MRISLWIPAIVFYYAVRIVLSNCIQVGTVLFTTSDLVKKCWTESDKALLKARLIMQDVLPDPDCIDFSKPDAILTLLEYFQSCYNIISVSSYGKMQDLMTLALSDSIGGYLRAYALPFAKRAYYSGEVNYSEAKKLFQLYNDIKDFLKTNGLGWAKPQKLCKFKLKVKPLVISDSGSESPCNQLYTIEKKRALRSCNTDAVKFEQDLNLENPRRLQSGVRQSYSEIMKESSDKANQNLNFGSREKSKTKSRLEKHEKLLRRKKKIREHKRIIEERKNDTKRHKKSLNLIKPGTNKRDCDSDMSQCPNAANSNTKIIVPLPVLEDGENIHTIAVPFKSRPLRNVQSRKSAFLLEHYYVAVIKCMMSKSSPKKDIRNFNAQFQTWLMSEVIPHLTDEQWYPAFGGVYRVIETIKKLGSSPGFKDIDFHDVGFIFSKDTEFKDSNIDADIEELTRKDKIRDVGEEEVEGFDGDSYEPQTYFIYGMLILMIAFICIVCACISYYCAIKWEKINGSITRYEKDVSEDKKEEGLVNFQFLIKFFKKNPMDDKERCSIDDEDDDQFYQLKKSTKQTKIEGEEFDKGNEIKRRRGSEDNTKTEDQTGDTFTRKKSNAEDKKAKEGGVGVGEGFELVLSTLDPAKPNFNRMVKSPWPYRASFIDFEKIEIAEKPPLIEKSITVLDTVNFQDRSQFEKLWKKSLNAFKHKETKSKCTKSSGHRLRRIETKETSASLSNEGGKSTELTITKGRSSCECCETCQSSTFAMTNSSSQIQIEEKISAEGAKYYNYEPVLIKRKAFKQRFVEESTVESESDKDQSYSSETESTETTLN